MLRIEICKDCHNTLANHAPTCPSRPPHEHIWGDWMPAGTIDDVWWPARRICRSRNCGHIEYENTKQ